MEASFQAMEVKCKKSCEKLINKLVEVTPGDSADVLLQRIDANVATLAKAKAVGLYLAAHHVGDTDDTFPPIEILAQLTAKYYEAGVQFRKINLNACFSAGKPGNAIEIGIKYEGNLVLKFCQDLVATLKSGSIFAGKKPMSPDILEGCMVAGYRSQVVLYNPKHPFFTTVDNEPYKLSRKLDERVRNVFRKDGSYFPTHPDGNKKFDAILGDSSLYDFTKIKNLNTDAKRRTTSHGAPEFTSGKYPDLTINESGSSLPAAKEIKADDMLKIPEQAAYLKSVLLYTLRKKIVRFGKGGNVSQISILDYTDNPDIRQMVVAVTKFNVTMQQAGWRIVL